MDSDKQLYSLGLLIWLIRVYFVANVILNRSIRIPASSKFKLLLYKSYTKSIPKIVNIVFTYKIIYHLFFLFATQLSLGVYIHI